MAEQLAHLCAGSLIVDAAQQPFRAILSLPALGHLAVLVIDDNLDAHQLLQRYVAGTRYRAVGTRQPQQAIHVAQELSPRVIVLDVMMPDVDGWEVLGRLRQIQLPAPYRLLCIPFYPKKLSLTLWALTLSCASR